MGKSSSQLSRSRPEHQQTSSNGGGSRRGKRKRPIAAAGSGDVYGAARLLLSEVVSDCKGRWFQDSLKEAKAGDVNMQVLVGQMYYSGYGVAKDADNGKFWMTRASRIRASVWKVRNKRPVTMPVILILRNQLMILDLFLQIEGSTLMADKFRGEFGGGEEISGWSI
ncbi:hypothetical protein OROMI_032234 [Orobanche minor]